jgi:hypothetical protein
MPSPDLVELMRLYARRGIADWASAPGELKRRALECLGTDIAENDAEAHVTLSTIFNGNNMNRLRFIPMPKHPRKGAERSFFAPIREQGAAGEKVAFDLFLVVSAKNCLAFRFEPSHPPISAHGYGHVQMSRMVLRKTVVTKSLPWLPDTYPAFPLLTSEPLKMFLSMTTAVHGYSTGVVALLKEIFQAEGRIRELGPYLDLLRGMLL